MKKLSYFLSALVAVALLATGCKGNNDPEKPNYGESEELNFGSPVGTEGMLDGNMGYVIDLGGNIGKVAIATMNKGASSTTKGAGTNSFADCYGDYYSYDHAMEWFKKGWYVPSKEEMEALASHMSPWVIDGENVGCKWDLGNKTIYLPCAGYVQDGQNVSRGWQGWYWTSTPDSDPYKAYGVQVAGGECTIVSGLNREREMSLRLFHKLPIDYAHWTEYLPGSTRLSALTIPALHDAATWMVDWDDVAVKTKKDQDKDYRTAWNYGARVFDMRLGYNNNPGAYGDFEERCSFYHGVNISDILCRLNKFSEDIPAHFPTPEQLSSSFMILMASMENNDEPDKNIDIFEYFMRLLINTYGSNCFIEYREGLTLDDLKGKIIMFVDEDSFTKDYSHIHGTAQVPINYMKDGEITTYVNATESNHYTCLVQNEWEVEDAEEKYGYIQDVLSKPVPELLFNQFNATDHGVTHESWPISSVLNGKICDDLVKSPLPSNYQRPLGIVLFDFCGVDLYEGEIYDYYFKGETLVKRLVEHNFRSW